LQLQVNGFGLKITEFTDRRLIVMGQVLIQWCRLNGINKATTATPQGMQADGIIQVRTTLVTFKVCISSHEQWTDYLGMAGG